jgi:teichuronic acid biosynthesis glycosyltransferase TuaC
VGSNLSTIDFAEIAWAHGVTASSLLSGDPLARPKGFLHVLVLTPFYPTATDDAQGCFIAESIPLLSAIGVDNTVLAVQPFYRTRAASHPLAFPSQQTRFMSFPGGLGLPTAGAFLFAKLLSTVRRLHQLNPIHVIHAHAALPCGHAAALLSRELGIPFVVTVHGLDAYYTEQVGGLSSNWCKQVSNFVYRSAKCVICVSEKVRDKTLEGPLNRVKTEVVYNGVDPEAFHPSADAAEAKTILCVGDLIPSKGQELLLRALAGVSSKFPEVSCEFIGDGPERSNLTRTAARLNLEGKARFFGRCSRDEVAKAMRRCTLFALPSRYEGLGCVYLEAMATGKSAIGCRGQGIAEVIEHGANGWLVDSGNVSQLTDALFGLLENGELRLALGGAARRTILRNFTLAHQAERLVRLYEECAG